MSEIDDLEIHELSGIGRRGIALKNVKEHTRRGMRTSIERSKDSSVRRRFFDNSTRPEPSLPRLKFLERD